MLTALEWANELGPPPSLPTSLFDEEGRTEFVTTANVFLDGFRKSVAKDQLHQFAEDEKTRCLTSLAEESRRYLKDVMDETLRTNITLRLWAGCLCAAKNIALETLSGKNTPEGRTAAFASIDAVARKDEIFCAGVQIASFFKRRLKEEYSFEGVPGGSPVRNCSRQSNGAIAS
jgi:hypothetical protein